MIKEEKNPFDDLFNPFRDLFVPTMGVSPSIPQEQPITATAGIKVPGMDELAQRQNLADVIPPAQERGFGEPPLTEREVAGIQEYGKPYVTGAEAGQRAAGKIKSEAIDILGIPIRPVQAAYQRLYATMKDPNVSKEVLDELAMQAMFPEIWGKDKLVSEVNDRIAGLTGAGDAERIATKVGLFIAEQVNPFFIGGAKAMTPTILTAGEKLQLLQNKFAISAGEAANWLRTSKIPEKVWNTALKAEEGLAKSMGAIPGPAGRELQTGMARIPRKAIPEILEAKAAQAIPKKPIDKVKPAPQIPPTTLKTAPPAQSLGVGKGIVPPGEKPPVPVPEPGFREIPDAPHLGMIGKALSGVEPHRVLLGRDPYGAEVARLSREAILNQSNLYKSLTSENKVFTKLGKSVDTDKMISLYEKGIAENADELAKLSVTEQQYIGLLKTYEQRTLDMAIKAGKDPTNWRFVGRYYPRLWEGSHKVITIGDKGAESIVNIAKNRADGIREMISLAKKNPDKNYILMPRWENLKPPSLPTGLTQQGYWKLVKEISNELAMPVNEVLEEISMQGIAMIKTPKTKIGNWLYRKGVLEGYIKDPVKAYNTLFYKLSKKVALESPLRRASGLLGKIKDSQLRQYASDLIDTVGGKYIPSPLSSKLTGSVLSVEANLKMGYRPTAAAINSMQQLYSLGIVDAADVVNSVKLLNSPEWKVISQKIGVASQPALYAGQATSRAVTPLYHPLGLFSAAETMNRTTVPALGYTMGKRLPLKEINNATSKGIRKFANQEELAVSFARDFNTAINYDYTKSDIMRLKRGGVGKTFLQFKDYPANHISNTIAVIKGKPLPGLERYFPNGLTRGQAIQQATVHFGLMLTQGGLKAVSFGAVTLLPASGIVWMAKNIPAILYGTPALLGADVSRSAAVEVIELIPDERWELLGATGGDIKRIKEATVLFLQGKNKEGAAKLTQLSPALNRAYKAIDAEANNGIMKVYRAGKMKFTPAELTMYGLGANPLRMAQGQEGVKGIKSPPSTPQTPSNPFADLFGDVKQQYNPFDDLFKEAK